MKPGTIYIAPPDRHLIVKPDHWIALSSADRVGWWRPAVDVLFKSAAEVYGTGAIAFDLGGADAMMSPQKIALALQVPAERTI